MTPGEHLHGKLGGMRFIRLLREINENKLTGILRLERGNIIKEIYFSDGEPINARSNMTRETLGRVLLDRGYISQEDYNQSLEMMGKTGKKHGEILMEMGVLPIGLKKALQMQAEDRILDVFTWEEGTYRFIERKDISKLIESLNLNSAKIIYEGVIKKAPISILENIMREYSKKKLVFNESSPILTRTNIRPSHLEFLRLFDGEKTVEEVVKSSGMNINQASRLILIGVLLDLLHLKHEKEEIPPPAEIEEEVKEEETLTDRDRTMLEALEKTITDMKKKNYLEIFNLDDDFSERDLKKNYFMLARSYHPDRFYTFHPRVKAVAEEIFTLINEAYQILSNPSERTNYIAMLRTGGRAVTEKDAQAALSAEMEFQKGQVLLKQGKLDQAKTYFERAVELNPDESEYAVFLGWTLFRLGKRSGDESLARKGKDMLTTAVEKVDGSEKGHFFLGQVLKVENDLTGAIKHFEKVVQINPDNVDAVRELRILRMRLEKEGGKKDKSGLFKKFFK